MVAGVRERERVDGLDVTPAAPGAVRPRWWSELAGLGLGYLAYEWLRAFADHSARLARAHAHDIYRAEQLMHVAVERWFNQLLATHPWDAGAAGYYYATGHFVVTVIVVIWLYVRHPGRYRPLRSALVLTTMTALAGYWVYPLAPPRLALAGFTDVVVRHDVLGAANPHGVMSMINLYAAMPSLHVAWAVWVGLAISRSVNHPARHLAWCYPVLTTAVVLGTANHYLLDAVAGAAIALLADVAVCHHASATHQLCPVPAKVASHA
jgi:PAP2 superfamily